ncbi:CSC1-like protein 1 (Transmembrane protein 63A) [Durusdinium trenchii]|uniref:CSC1-like protein 1 (Transmembrane protein 63A) n=1 Tax=Durusdinium trenchii TaxID=1381693 RepID=A0ABP0HET1_9DINO
MGRGLRQRGGGALVPAHGPATPVPSVPAARKPSAERSGGAATASSHEADGTDKEQHAPSPPKVLVKELKLGGSKSKKNHEEDHVPAPTAASLPLAAPKATLSPTLAPTLAKLVADQTSTKSIGQGIVVVTDESGGKMLAIDASNEKLSLSKPFQPPQGWASIGYVCAFGAAIFLPVMTVAALRFIHRSVRHKETLAGRTKAAMALLADIVRTGFLNTTRLRHRRGEDLENLGSEAALYLAIHRETAVLVLLMTVLGCSILLPLHLSAGSERVKLEFTRSTIQHLDKHSRLLWVHLLFVVVFSTLYFRYAARCRQHVQWAWRHGVMGARSVDMWDASVFVKSKLPEHVSEADAKRLLEVVYPGHISNVIVIMDNSESIRLERKMVQVEQKVKHLRRLASSGEPQEGMLRAKELELQELKELESQLQDKHVGKCIITFQSVGLASEFSNPRLRAKAIQAVVEPKELQDELKGAKLHEWDVVQSPDPHDIIWEALHLDPKLYWVRTVFANVVIGVFLVLLTTPTSILGLASHIGQGADVNDQGDQIERFLLKMIESIRDRHPSLANFLFVFLPQLVLVTVNNLLMWLVYVVAKHWEPHHTYSSQEISILGKTFWFLLVSTILVPALAFKSLNGIVGDLISSDASPFALLGQVFVVTSGAFTLTYIITQTLVGSSFQVINLTTIFSRFIFGSKVFRPWASPEELRQAREEKSSFDFGSEYATFLSILVLVVMFSTTVPIMLPFGLAFFFVKICVDQHQLHFVCGRDKSHSVPRCRIGRAAVRYLPVPLLLYQIGMIGYFSSFVCVPNRIAPIAAGRNPIGCTAVSDQDSNVAIPGTQVIRGSVVQLLILFALFIYTASDSLYVFFIDTFNEEGLAVASGFIHQPFASESERILLKRQSSQDRPSGSQSGQHQPSALSTLWQTFTSRLGAFTQPG